MLLPLLIPLLLHSKLSFAQRSVNDNSDDSDDDRSFGILLEADRKVSNLRIYSWPAEKGAGQLYAVSQLRGKGGQPFLARSSPGLSDFASRPQQAAKYIDPLLRFAENLIPKEKYSDTPLFIMGTEGLRRLSENARQKILEALRRHIQLTYRFLFSDRHVDIITVQHETAFSWITANFLLGRFSHNASSGNRTAGVVELGRRDLQLAFEMENVTALPEARAVGFKLGCLQGDDGHTFRLYVGNFSNFGVQAARKRWEAALGGGGADPCLPAGLKLPKRRTGSSLRGSGDLQRCLQGLRGRLLGLDKPCAMQPCSMAGVHQPAIDFLHTEFYGLYEFWNVSEDVFHLGGQFDQESFRNATEEFCSTKWTTFVTKFVEGAYREGVTLNHLMQQCFDAAWLLTVLYQGLHFPASGLNFRTAREIDGTQPHWTLGAFLFKIHNSTWLFNLTSSSKPAPSAKPRALDPSSAFLPASLSSQYFLDILPLLLSTLIIAAAVGILHTHLSIRKTQ